VYLNLVQKAVYVASDGGRVCRPLLVVENGKILLTQDHIRRLGSGIQLEDLLAQGIIEYVDVGSPPLPALLLFDSASGERREQLSHLPQRAWADQR
jgi:hypothetical protein